ncbi:MAG: DUF4125 family protein, partial [Desulfovibrionaceae bacterium]|nr:DUF4125 family protein [Desulfovibrionaceae bacterium]
KDSLPPISKKAQEMIQEILAIHQDWQQEVASKYPHILSHTRPKEQGQNEHGVTSLVTYLRGELQTYSEKTLSLYLQKVQEKVRMKQNEAEENLLNQVKQYGFSSLQACEEKLAAQA